jgi:hypothetical protein
MAYNMDRGLDPITEDHAPSSQDYAPFGTIWLDQSADDVYISCNTDSSGFMTWVACGGGSSTFSTITVNPGNIAVTAGTIVLSAFGRGLVTSTSTGTLASSNGTNGQIMIAKTNDMPIWAEITAGAGITVTNAANAITIEATGVTASTFVTTSGGPISPLLGATSVLGYNSNITTDGATANTIKIRLADTVSVAGALTAGVNLNMTSGIATIDATANSSQAIYLHTDGGVNETIEIDVDQGTAATSIYAHSDVGGITIDAGKTGAGAVTIAASHAGGGVAINSGTAGTIITTVGGAFTVATGVGTVSIGADAAVKNCTLGSITGASATTIQSGSGNLSLTSTGTGGFTTTGTLTLTAGSHVSVQSSAGNISIGTDAVALTATIGNGTGAARTIIDCGTGGADFGITGNAHLTRVGSTTGGSATTVQAGAGALVLNGGAAVTIDAVGALELNTSAGAINIATDSVAVVTTIGNGTGASSVIVNCGTAAASFAANATVHTTTIGSVTGASSTIVQAGAAALTINGGADVTVDAVGVLEFNSSAGVIGIGNDAVAQNINIGTGGAARIITLGNNTTTTGVVVTSGTGDIALDSADAVTIDAAGVLELNSSAGVIGIGNDAVSQAISIGTAGTRTLTMGSSTATSSVLINGGTGAMQFAANATDHTTTVGSVTGVSASTLQAGTGALSITGSGNIVASAGGLVTIDSVGVLDLNSSGAAINIGQDAVNQAINIGTAGTRTVTIGSATSTSSVILNTGTGNLDLGVNATEHAVRLGSTTTASATTVQAGTGALIINGGGAVTLDAVGVLELNSSGDAIGIGNDNANFAVNIGTAGTRTVTIGSAAATSSVIVDGGTGAMQFGANATEHATTIGSTTTASATTLQAGTGGLDINAAGLVRMAPAVDTQAAATVTINANVGVGTFTGLTTAAAAVETLTVTNSLCTATSAILCTVASVGAEDAQLTIQRVCPGTGSFVVKVKNNGAASLATNVILTFWIIKAS